SIMDVFQSNPVLGHITTFGGHPVCCAAGLAALNYIIDNNLVEAVAAKSALFLKLLGDNKNIVDIRSGGLLIAVEFGDNKLCGDVCRASVEAGILTESFLFCESAMRIAPPLTISLSEIREVCETLNRVINEVCGK
ncbi:MAG: aminotransferase class III-fold pyridoxal phosphate-dependent enzyme, partial [Rikenellaceae bacterium]